MPRTPPSRPPAALLGIALLALLAMFPRALRASPAGMDPDRLYEGWRWSQLGQQEGLPAEGALQVVEDTEGTIWVTTTRGPAWFDGYRFHPADGVPAQTAEGLRALADGRVALTVAGVLYLGDRSGFAPLDLPFRVFNLAYDAGGLLMLSRANQLYRLDGDRAVAEALPPGLAPNQIRSLREGGDSVWLRSPRGLYRRRAGDGWVLEVPGKEIQRVTVGADARRFGAVELPVADRGLWTWRPGEPAARVAEAAADLIVAITADRDGRVLAMHESGQTDLYDGADWHILDPVPSQLAGTRFATFRRNGDLLLATDRGLRIFRVSDTMWDRWSTEGASARNRVDEILTTRNGDVWLGTDAGLEVRHADGRVSWFDRAAGRDLRIVTGLAEDPQGGVWVSSGAYWEGALRWFEDRWRFYGPGDGLAASRIHRIHRDGAGRLWFLGLGSGTGVARTVPAAVVTWHDGVFAPYRLDPRLEAGRVHSFAEGTDGALWFSGARGIARRRDGAWQVWDTAHGLRQGSVFVLAPADDGGVWFGDQRHGLGHVSAAGEVTYRDSRDGLVDDAVWDLARDDEGVLWIATRGGLAAYREGHWTRFGRDSGLASELLWPIAMDGSRVLVGSAGQGTIILDRSTATRFPHRVFLAPPLQSERQTVVRWQALAHEGRVPAARLQTRTRLDDGPWSAWSTGRELLLADLAPGPHRVTVEAAGRTGGARRAASEIDFVVQPPMHARPLFYVPLGLAGLALALLTGASVARRRGDRQRLAASENRYRSFFDQAPISLWEFDFSASPQLRLRPGADPEPLAEALRAQPRRIVAIMRSARVLAVNDAALELFECPDRETLVTRLPRFFRAESLPALADGFAAMAAGRDRYSAETVIVTCRGSQRNVLISWVVSPDTEHAHSRVVTSMLDVTRQRQAEEEMRTALRVAEEANSAKSSFLANTSHEIRTPINAVMGMAQALRDESLTPRAQEQVDTILQASESLAEIIDDLLDLSKIEADQLELTQLPFDPVEVFEAARATLAARAAGKGLDLDLEVDRSVPRAALGDRIRLRQILLNLVGNAVKFTARGGVHVSVRAEAGPQRLVLRVEVRDTGIGIPPDRLAAIFDPFTQADASITRTHGGTGLGLSISKRLVEMMGGELTAHSEPGVGSRFAFHVLLRPAKAEDVAPSPVAEAAAAGDTRPLRILLAEDNDLNRKVARALLRKDAHRIVEAVHGAEAVERVRHEAPFDAILMDMQMPVMDGLTATARIRELEGLEGRARATIIALTANAMAADRERCLQAGMDDFLAKPVRQDSLRAALARIGAAGESGPPAPAAEGTQPPVLDPAPLADLRELEADGDFSLAEFVELFAGSVPECLARARRARADGDDEALHREVHTVKGSAREVGALRLAQRAEVWEQRLKEGEADGIEAGLDELEGLFGETDAALRAGPRARSRPARSAGRAAG